MTGLEPKLCPTMKIAVEGCLHGNLSEVYDYIASIETQEGYKVDLVSLP